METSVPDICAVGDAVQVKHYVTGDDAPPYSSAKDPVNMVGFMIDNIAKGTLKQWHLEEWLVNHILYVDGQIPQE